MTIVRLSRHALRHARREHGARRRRSQEALLQRVLAFTQAPLAEQLIHERPAVQAMMDGLHRFHVAGLVARSVLEPAALRRAVRPLSRAHLRALHTELGRLVVTLWPVDPTAAAGLYRVSVARRTYAVTRAISGTISIVALVRWPATIEVGLLDLVREYGARVERCPARLGGVVCGRLFLRRRRQICCSVRCAQRERSRRWYATQRTARGRDRRASRDDAGI